MCGMVPSSRYLSYIIWSGQDDHAPLSGDGL
jgi:hypothetical protein